MLLAHEEQQQGAMDKDRTVAKWTTAVLETTAGFVCGEEWRRPVAWAAAYCYVPEKLLAAMSSVPALLSEAVRLVSIYSSLIML